jgi:hypothetical protein
MHSKEVVTEHLRNQQIYFGTSPDLFHFGFELDNCFANCVLQALECSVRLAIDGVKCPEGRIGELSRFALAANLDTSGGRFDLDERSGRFSFVNEIHFCPGDLADGIVNQLISKTIYDYDRFLPGAMKVMYGEEDALKAAEDCKRLISAVDVQEIEWSDTMDRLMGSDEGLD